MKGSKLPPGCRYIEIRCNFLRRQCEAAVIALKGEVSLTDAAAINSILRWERHGMLAEHWLRKEMATLSPSDRLRFSEAIAKASDNRDRNIRQLGLDRDSTRDVLDTLYRRPGLALPKPNGDGSHDGAGGLRDDDK
jgi:hypothetical protein